jgi:ketosteroid isomerase-like protein
MSEENLALVRRTYELINGIGRMGDEFVDPEEVAPDIWARLASDFEVHGRPDVPDSKVYRGRDEAKEFFRMLEGVFSELRWEPLEFVDLDHAVVVETRLTVVGRGSDVRIEGDETDVFWFRDGELVRLQAFPTKADALAAADRVL